MNPNSYNEEDQPVGYKKPPLCHYCGSVAPSGDARNLWIDYHEAWYHKAWHNLKKATSVWLKDSEVRAHVYQHHLRRSQGYLCLCHEGETFRIKKGWE